jgi:hypothetical protein
MLKNIVSSNTKKLLNLLVLIIIFPLFIYAVYQTVNLFSHAAGTKANLIIDTKNIIGTYDGNFYHAFAQGGEETGDMLKPVVNQIKQLQPRQIRIDHIYDNYQVVSRQNGLTYDFSRLDIAVSSIITTGAQPFFSLSYMPQAIAKDGNVINPPNDWNEWSNVVKATIEHYSGKNGKNLNNIYYEVWNEPDLAQFGKWNITGDKNYLTLYKYAINGANDSANCNKFYIGGPATTGLNKNWILALAQSNLRLDFLSWHSYLEEPAQFLRDENNIVSWLLSYPALVISPKIISEYGFTGDKDNRYGTQYAAAFTASVIRYLADATPSYIFSFQLIDGPGQNNGEGWGLMTHETNGSKPKPRYYVYNFLDALDGKRLKVTGEGTWVSSLATMTNDTIRVMLVNFDQSGYHSESVPVIVRNLDSGTYHWNIKYLFPNLYHETNCLDSEKTSSSVNVAFGSGFSGNICLSPQNVAILELTKQP